MLETFKYLFCFIKIIPICSRSLRNVLRLRHLSGLRVRKKRYPTRSGLVLPHAPAERRHLAHRGHALRPALHLALSPSHARHHLASFHSNTRLAAHGPRRLHGLRLDPNMDRPILDYNPDDP